MDHRDVGTPEANPKQGGLRVLVGEPWPGDVRIEKSDRRSRLAFGLCVLLAVLLVAYAAYGMVTSDHQIHEKVLEMIRLGVIAVVAWVFGRDSR